MIKRLQRRSGFVLLMAVGTLPLVAVALEAVASLIAADIRQTRQDYEHAQVEQLLLAGILTATRGQTIELPPSLSAAGASITFDDNQVGASLGHTRQTYSLSSTSIKP